MDLPCARATGVDWHCSTAVRWVCFFYFISGLCALIDEVVWVRLLKLTLGNTVYASCIVVSVFLAGLALGGLAMGRWADRLHRPLRWYAIIEALVTVSALGLPWALTWLDAAYAWFFRAYEPAPALVLSVQALLSSVLLLIPTMLMGSTFPLLARFVVSRTSPMGQRVGHLYALNMLGAAMGAFLAGFILIRAMGVMETLYLAAALNLMVSLSAAWLSARVEPSAPMGTERLLAEKAQDYIPPANPLLADGEGRGGGVLDRLPLIRADRLFLSAAFFASGFISIGYQLLWMRSIVHLLGADTYVFSSVLTIYLLGNVAGAGIGSWICRRAINERIGFGLTLSTLGVMGILYVPFLVGLSAVLLPHTDPLLYQAYVKDPGLFSWAYPLLHCAVFFLLPSMVMGLGFPLALQAWDRQPGDVGRTTGRIYGLNTLGCVMGGIVTGFVLVPNLGLQSSMVLLGLAGLWMGVALIGRARSRPGLLRVGAVAVAGVVSLVALSLPTDLFRTQLVKYNQTRLLAVREGVTTTVSVHAEEGGARWLCTSGLQVAGDRSKSVQRMLGHFGVLLHPNPKSVLTVGFGTGETTACLAQHALQRIDCVEISPELVELSLEFFPNLNLGKSLNEKVRMIYMDAKNYLRLTSERYDVIMSDSINPKYFAENASLYTEEYFRSAADHLNPGGLVVCWIPFTLPVSCFDSILGTFQQVFPSTSLWFPTTDPDHFVLLVGSLNPQQYSLRHIQEGLSRPEVRNSLAAVHIRDPLDLFGCYIGDERDLRRYLRDFRLNSDYFPYVEFSTDPFLDEQAKWMFVGRLIQKVRSPSAHEHVAWSTFSTELKDAWIEDYKLSYRINASQLKAVGTPDPADGALKAALETEDLDGLFASLSAYLPRHTEYLPGFNMRGGIYHRRGELDKAIVDFSRSIEIDPENAFARNNRGACYIRKGLFDLAIADFDRALLTKPNYYRALVNRSVAYTQQGDFDRACADCDTALKVNPRGVAALVQRGITWVGKENEDRALADFTQALDIEPGNLDALFSRASIYQGNGAYTKAVADYERILKYSPREAQAYAGRAWAYYELRQYDLACKDLKMCQELGEEPAPELIEKLREAMKTSFPQNLRKANIDPNP